MEITPLWLSPGLASSGKLDLQWMDECVSSACLGFKLIQKRKERGYFPTYIGNPRVHKGSECDSLVERKASAPREGPSPSTKKQCHLVL